LKKSLASPGIPIPKKFLPDLIFYPLEAGKHKAKNISIKDEHIAPPFSSSATA